MVTSKLSAKTGAELSPLSGRGLKRREVGKGTQAGCSPLGQWAAAKQVKKFLASVHSGAWYSHPER